MPSLKEYFASIFGRKSAQKPSYAARDQRTWLYPDVHNATQMVVGTGQSVGIERSHNEDALLVLTGQLAGSQPLPDFGLFVVADGMGGHRAGEVASAVSIRTVARMITQDTVIHLLNNDHSMPESPLQDLLREALEEANRAVVEEVPGGGTTLTAAVLLGPQLTIGHVGDTRAYYIRDGKTEILTRDHSLVERLKELGQLTAEEASVHPQRNVLYRAIGQGANLEVDVFTHPLPKGGGHLLICSDGLWGVVPDDKIQRIVNNATHPQIAAQELITAANSAGGPDNITVILVRFPKD
jgi:serine/threonine protein phosphatase PrpC